MTSLDDITPLWEFSDFTMLDDAMGRLASNSQGSAELRELFQPGQCISLEELQRIEDDEYDEPRGLSDYIGNAGLHPDRTPTDVLMDDEPRSLTVGYAMLAEGDDSYYGREGGLTY